MHLSKEINTSDLVIPHGIVPADEKFNQPSEILCLIDMLKQLSLDERENFPKAADIVLHDVYLDDILSGCSSLNELELLKTELTQLFKSAGMSLHKWCFSHSTNDFPDLHFDQSSEESIRKTLGVL
ncbi:uncharacterized protein TNCV_4662351 [Trichonephila clavipes]|uniref:Uncharacterized protein n=1 Tax=Trichonephila clavipes TaxID=2585209 RepID=A0A8X6S8W7_TRICX|nr:uncharacterized protein TNCV_4662351 [Trichonephila clavipes]